jgi:hypothetical protein
MGRSLPQNSQYPLIIIAFLLFLHNAGVDPFRTLSNL